MNAVSRALDGKKYTIGYARAGVHNENDGNGWQAFTEGCWQANRVCKAATGMMDKAFTYCQLIEWHFTYHHIIDYHNNLCHALPNLEDTW